MVVMCLVMCGDLSLPRQDFRRSPTGGRLAAPPRLSPKSKLAVDFLLSVQMDCFLLSVDVRLPANLRSPTNLREV